MRAQLVEQPKVRTLSDQQIVDRPQHRTEAVGIRHPPLGTQRAAAIAGRLRVSGDQPLEQSPIISPLQFAQQRPVQRVGKCHLGTWEDRTGKGAAGPGVRPQQREWIGILSLKQRFDGFCRWLHITFQISLAYSVIVRSDENQPTLAIFLIAAARQFA